MHKGPSEYFDDARRSLESTLAPAARRLQEFGVSSNQCRAAGLMIAVASGLCIAQFADSHWTLLLVPLSLKVTYLLDAVIRSLNQQPGAADSDDPMLKLMCDAAGESAVVLPMAAVPGICPYLMSSAAVLSLLTELAGLSALLRGAARRQDGPLAAGTRAVTFGGIGLIIGLGATPGRWLDFLVGTINLLLLATIVNRCRKALRAGETAGSKNELSDESEEQ